jgi:hypothetical protein
LPETILATAEEETLLARLTTVYTETDGDRP